MERVGSGVPVPAPPHQLGDLGSRQLISPHPGVLTSGKEPASHLDDVARPTRCSPPEAEQGHGPGSSGSKRPWRSWRLLEPQFPLWGRVMPLRQCGSRLSPWRVETVPLLEDGQTLRLPRLTEQDARDRGDGHEG